MVLASEREISVCDGRVCPKAERTMLAVCSCLGHRGLPRTPGVKTGGGPGGILAKQSNARALFGVAFL